MRLRHWSWGRIIRKVPEPGVEEPRQISQDQLLADMADMLRCQSFRMPTAPPREIGSIARSLLDTADVIESLQVVKHEPTLGLEAMATARYRSAGH
ncbi:MAG: hypothetical protein V3V08_05540 [Nannocystaceae bacterium]